ncbi:MAG: neutral/alkaline non-lysosomal ceramidase N-terminal domain-containing protein [Myxococcota bacterium]|nr:neutral/alkaline non-lysosomal ceramidase N-terminal domain-containing protein [Myxococcota bacterium]
MTPLLHMGFGRADIPAIGSGRAKQGWGQAHFTATHGDEPLQCRAWATRSGADGAVQVLVLAEICFMTGVVRRRAEALLADRHGMAPDAVMMCATHNHSGPGGYASTLWFDIPCGGRDEAMVDGIAGAIAAATARAIGSLQPVQAWTLRADSGLQSLLHNRAWRAYNRNEGVTPVEASTAHLATDPAMDLVRVDTMDGRPLGLVSWFGLHGTCLQSEHAIVSPDHKGTSARLLEERFGDGFIAILAQGPTGDVTTNSTWDARSGRTTGPFGRGKDNLQAIAEAQARACTQLHASAPEQGQPMQGPLLGVQEVVDFPSVTLPDGPGGSRPVIGPELGLGVVLGTLEGPGPVGAGAPTRLLVETLRRIGTTGGGSRDDDTLRARAGRLPLVTQGDDGEGRILGRVLLSNALVPAFIDDQLRRTQKELQDGTAPVRTWLPRTLPVQVQRIGPLLVAGLGGEPTTTAGHRLRAALAEVHDGPVALTTYAGEYGGYIVTPEEFAEHGYESGSTMFGRWTLDAWCQELVRLAGRIGAGAVASEHAPPAPPPHSTG